MSVLGRHRLAVLPFLISVGLVVGFAGSAGATPVATTTSGAVVANNSYQIVHSEPTLLQFDAHDANGDPLTFQVTQQPSRGTLSGDYPNITYTPQSGYAGNDGLQYRVTNPSGDSATAIVSLSVRKPLVVHGDGWTETTIHEPVDDRSEQNPYTVAVDDHGTAYFATMDFNQGGGQLVAQAPDGSETHLPWSWSDDFVGYPYSLDADAQGNLYATVIADSRGNLSTRMLPAGGDHPVSLPLPNPQQAYAVPPSIAASASGDLALCDAEGGKVYVLLAGASTASQVPLPSGLRPYDVEIARNGSLYVLAKKFGSGNPESYIVKMAMDGSNPQTTTVNGEAYGIAVADDGTVYVAGAPPSSSAYSIDRMSPDGTLTPVSDAFDLYNTWNGIEVDRHGSVYGAEIWGDRVVRIDFSRSSSLTASSSERTVKAGTTAAVALTAFDTEGQALTYDVLQGPAHGVLAGDAPALTYTPEDGFTGTDSLTYRVTTADGDTAEATVTLDVVADGTQAVTQTAAPGETVTTGYQPTGDEPTQAAVTTPVSGDVTITQDASVADPTGYAVVGTQYRIEAPQASVQSPLRLVFTIAADQLPAGQGADDVAIFRDGTLIADCTDQSGTAVPDPCVASRTTADGVVTLTVLSSHASAWTLAVQQLATTTTLAPVAPSTYGQAVTLSATVTQPGSAPATGTVEFRDTSASPAKVLGTAPVAADGTARLAGVLLDAGDHAITASYSGSATSLPSVSAPVAVRVSKAPVVVKTKAAAGLVSLLTFRIAYTTTVTSAVTGQPVAGVSVTTRVNGGAPSSGCTAVTTANGVATCTAGPVNVALGGSYTATSAATANYQAGVGTGKLALL